jgi:hypothetical protein
MFNVRLTIPGSTNGWLSSIANGVAHINFFWSGQEIVSFSMDGKSQWFERTEIHRLSIPDEISRRICVSSPCPPSQQPPPRVSRTGLRPLTTAEGFEIIGWDSLIVDGELTPCHAPVISHEGRVVHALNHLWCFFCRKWVRYGGTIGHAVSSRGAHSRSTSHGASVSQGMSRYRRSRLA